MRIPAGATLVLLSVLLVRPPCGDTKDDIPHSVTFKASLGPVFFLHDRHREITKNNCGVCHHLKEEGTKQACRACHKKKAQMVEGDPPSFFDVKMNFCRECHTKARSEDQNSKAPTACSECHEVKNIDWSQ